MSQPPDLSGFPLASPQLQPPAAQAAAQSSVGHATASSSSASSSSASSLRSVVGQVFTVRNSLIVSGTVVAACSAYALYRWWSAATPGRPSASSSSASHSRTPGASSAPARRRSPPPTLSVSPAEAAAALREDSKQDLLTSRMRLPERHEKPQLPPAQAEETERKAEQLQPELMSIDEQSPAIMQALTHESQQDLKGELRPTPAATTATHATSLTAPLPPLSPQQPASTFVSISPKAESALAISAMPSLQPDVASMASAASSNELSAAPLPAVAPSLPAVSPPSAPAAPTVILDTRLDPVVPAAAAIISPSPRSPIAPATEPPLSRVSSSPADSVIVTADSSSSSLASSLASSSLPPPPAAPLPLDSETSHETAVSEASSVLQPASEPSAAVSVPPSAPAEESLQAAVLLPPAPSITLSTSAPFFLPQPSPAAAAVTPSSSSSTAPLAVTEAASPLAPQQVEQLVHRSVLGMELLAVAVLLVAVFAAAVDARWLLPLAPVVAYVLFLCTQAVMKQPSASVLFPTTLLTAAERLTATTSSASAFSPFPLPSPSSASSDRPLRPVRVPPSAARSVQRQRPPAAVSRSSSAIPTVSASHPAVSHAAAPSMAQTVSPAPDLMSSVQHSSSSSSVHVSGFNSSVSGSSSSSGDDDAEMLGGQPVEEDEKQPSAAHVSVGRKSVAHEVRNIEPVVEGDDGKEEKKERQFAVAPASLVSSLDSAAGEGVQTSATSSPRLSASSSAAVASSNLDTEADASQQQQEQQLSSPAAADSADDRERSFFSPEPAAPVSGASSIALTVKFTYRHPWEEVVQAFWDVTQPDWERNGHTLGLAASRVATPPSASSSSSPRSASGSAAAAASTDGIEHKVLEHWRSASTGCVYIRRELHVRLKIPAVVKRCVGPVKRVTVEEKVELDAGNRLCRLQTTNPGLHKFLHIHETRTFSVHPERAEWCVLSCRFRVALQPACGLLKGTMHKWLSLTWKQQQQEMAQRMARRLELLSAQSGGDELQPGSAERLLTLQEAIQAGGLPGLTVSTMDDARSDGNDDNAFLAPSPLS